MYLLGSGVLTQILFGIEFKWIKLVLMIGSAAPRPRVSSPTMASSQGLNRSLEMSDVECVSCPPYCELLCFFVSPKEGSVFRQRFSDSGRDRTPSHSVCWFWSGFRGIMWPFMQISFLPGDRGFYTEGLQGDEAQKHMHLCLTPPPAHAGRSTNTQTVSFPEWRTLL